MDKQLNFKRIKMLCHARNMTMEQLSERLGRAYSGFRRACTVGSFQAHEMPEIALHLNMSLDELYSELSVMDEAAEPQASYAAKRKLASIKDPLDFIRALQQRSDELDELLSGTKKRPKKS